MPFRFVLRVLWFYIGLTVVSAGYALIIRPGFGAAPWDILHLGLNLQTGAPLARVVQLTGAGVILVDLLLGVRPNLGMLLNMLSMGPILQFILPRLPLPQSAIGGWLMLALGIFLAGLGTALYASADLGTGPRDSMMIALTRRLRLPVAVIKNSIDLTVALVGWQLGGPLGVGTLLVAFGLGPAMQAGFYLVGRLARIGSFAHFVHPVALTTAPSPTQSD